MRPCIITDEISQDLTSVLDLCQRHNFPAIEVRSVWHKPPQELTLRECREIGALAADNGITIAGFAPPVFKAALPRSASDIAASADLLEKSCAQCEAMGTNLLRIFPFFREGSPDTVRAAEAMNTVLEKVSTSGLKLGMETGTLTNCPTAGLAQQLLKQLGHPEIGIVWDPGNSVFAGFADGSGLCGLDEIEPDALFHVHIKDPRGTSGYVELGSGDLQWLSILEALEGQNYTGYLSLETHWRLDRTLTGPERDEPWGEGISKGGYEASDICMGTLSQWLRERKVAAA